MSKKNGKNMRLITKIKEFIIVNINDKYDIFLFKKNME